MDNESTGDAVRRSRRDVLKKAGVGAAIVWATPVVSSVISPAAAQTIGNSGECSTYWRVKFEEENGYATCVTGVGANDCLSSPPVGSWGDGCAGLPVDKQPTASGDATSVTVTLPAGATPVAMAASIKAGSANQGGPCYYDGDSGVSITVNGNQITLTKTGDPEISHVQLGFCLDFEEED